MLEANAKQTRTPYPYPYPTPSSLEQGEEESLRETISLAEQVRQLWERHHGKASISGKNRGIIRKLTVSFPVLAFSVWLVKRVPKGKPVDTWL